MSMDFHGNANVMYVFLWGLYPYTLSLLNIISPMFRLGCTQDYDPRKYHLL